MPFKPVDPNPDFAEQERALIDFWADNNMFEKTRQLRRGSPKKWSFVDGPITANNPMGVHHGWGRTYKDLYNRFWTMQGHELRYQNGFDCQGLWVEVEVEKALNFQSKRDIEEYGLAEFVNRCKERVLKYAAVQTRQSIRLGYAMDWNDPDELDRLAELLREDPSQVITVTGPNGPVTDTVEALVGRLGMPELGGSYFTFSTENNYMIWTFLKRVHEKGWLYRGADVMPWCPRCATAISQHEIVTDGYAEVTHRSVTLQFPLRGRDNESLLVWTTTPWTLSSNVAAAVGPELTYVKVRQGDKIHYLSKGALKQLTGRYEVLAELKGEEMIGWTYDGPFDELPAAQNPGGWTALNELIEGVEQSAVEAHQIIAWDDVGEEEGTGIVHIAPGCGAEDFQLGRDLKFPIVSPIDDEGHFIDGFDWLTGQSAGEIASQIFKSLEDKGVLYKVEEYTHRYPTCWRCGTDLVFRLVDEWFIDMGTLYDKPRSQVTPEEKEASLRYQIMDITEQINWVPAFGKERELDWLRNMHDWMISKKRYWGLALPIWECDSESCNHFEVMGDENELESRAVEGWQTFAGHTPHRPYVDAVKIDCPQCGSTMTRIKDVGNPWLDAGIVSFSTLQYRTNPEFWREWYPADLTSESFPGQFRNWFYSLLVMATVLEGTPPFRNNFSYATLFAEDGRAMHKSWGNSIEFNTAADKMGVDVMRWLYCNHKPENNLLFGYNRADAVRRQFLIPVWNIYKFLVTYATLDGWQPGETLQLDSPNVLDVWVLSRLNQVADKVQTALVAYDAMSATMALETFINDLTNWYIRRSRRRFWRSEQDDDKTYAYNVLYHVVTTLIKLLAPITPFITETIYQNTVRSVNPNAPESVHHCDYPVADMAAVNQTVLNQMALARQICSLGLSARSGANLKVRQPLARVLTHLGEGKSELDAPYVEIVLDELNVKSFEFVGDAADLVAYQILPDNKTLGPRFGKSFPKVRQALTAADPDQIVAGVQAGQVVTLTIDGETVELAPEEIVIRTQPAQGLAVAADKVVTVAIDTEISDALAAEGLAREIVRRVQNMRKEADFNIEDTIYLYYQASGRAVRVLEEWLDYVKTETLAVEVQRQLVPEQAFVKKETIDGETIILGVVRAT